MKLGELRSSIVLACVGLLVAFSVAGCKKTVPVKSPTASAPTSTPTTTGQAPTLTLSISPGTIEKGQSATLTWNANNAQSVTIEPLGTVPTAGSRTVSPENSTTYNGRAVSGSQSAEATARLTVTTSTEPRGNPTNVPPDEGGLEWSRDVQDIHFDYDRYNIRSEDETILRRNADVFKKYADATIIVEGHCDERGTEEYNQALGDRRATAAKEGLVKLGVPASRITTVSFGASKPLDPGQNEAAWAKNRRAHFARK